MTVNRKVIKGAIRSKTMRFNAGAFILIMAAMLNHVIEFSPVFKEFVDPLYYYIAMGVLTTVNAGLRTVTNKGLEDRGDDHP